MQSERNAGTWILARAPHPKARVRLVCFPYAGAGASAFRDWENEFPAEVHVCRIQLPGREDRLREPALTDAGELASALVRNLEPWLDLPLVFFGHSMGALLAFEVQRQLWSAYRIRPKHLFLSARRAPHLPSRKHDLHSLPEQELRQELQRLNGTDERVFRDKELMALLLPTLRADFRVCETHVYSPEEPSPVSISVFGGLADSETTQDELEGWSNHSIAEIRLRMFPGNHFFLNQMRSKVIAAVLEDLRPFLAHSGDRVAAASAPGI